MYNRAQRRKDTEEFLKEMKPVLNDTYDDNYQRIFVELSSFLDKRITIVEDSTNEFLEPIELAGIIGSQMAIQKLEYDYCDYNISDMAIMESMVRGYLSSRYIQYAEDNGISAEVLFEPRVDLVNKKLNITTHHEVENTSIVEKFLSTLK